MAFFLVWVEEEEEDGEGGGGNQKNSTSTLTRKRNECFYELIYEHFYYTFQQPTNLNIHIALIYHRFWFFSRTLCKKVPIGYMHHHIGLGFSPCSGSTDRMLIHTYAHFHFRSFVNNDPSFLDYIFPFLHVTKVSQLESIIGINRYRFVTVVITFFFFK